MMRYHAVNRHTIIAIVLWLLVGCALVLVFNFYPRLLLLPGYVLLVPALAIVVYYVGWRRKPTQNRTRLFLGRFGPKALGTAASVSFVIGFAWAGLVGRALRSDPDDLLFFAVVVIPACAMILLTGILASLAIYYAVNRN